MGQKVSRDPDVVIENLSFRESALRIKHLVNIGDLDLGFSDFQFSPVRTHASSLRPRQAAPFLEFLLLREWAVSRILRCNTDARSITLVAAFFRFGAGSSAPLLSIFFSIIASRASRYSSL